MNNTIKTNVMGKRPRIVRREKLYQTGELYKVVLPNVPGTHICIILNEDNRNGHQECIPVCNFTGTKVPSGEYAIDISKYELPEEWFDEKKPSSWIRCNDIDCVDSYKVVSEEPLGNIKDDFPELWLDVCTATAACPISQKLSNACDCQYEVIERQMKDGLIPEMDCGCAT